LPLPREGSVVLGLPSSTQRPGNGSCCIQSHTWCIRAQGGAATATRDAEATRRNQAGTPPARTDRALHDRPASARGQLGRILVRTGRAAHLARMVRPRGRVRSPAPRRRRGPSPKEPPRTQRCAAGGTGASRCATNWTLVLLLTTPRLQPHHPRPPDPHLPILTTMLWCCCHDGHHDRRWR
jgi:hypothetical protein